MNRALRDISLLLKLPIMYPFAPTFSRGKNITSLMKNGYSQMSFLLNIWSSMVKLSEVMGGKHIHSPQAVGRGIEFGTMAGWNTASRRRAHCYPWCLPGNSYFVMLISSYLVLLIVSKGKIRFLLQIRKSNHRKINSQCTSGSCLRAIPFATDVTYPTQGWMQGKNWLDLTPEETRIWCASGKVARCDKYKYVASNSSELQVRGAWVAQ